MLSEELGQKNSIFLGLFNRNPKLLGPTATMLGHIGPEGRLSINEIVVQDVISILLIHRRLNRAVRVDVPSTNNAPYPREP